MNYQKYFQAVGLSLSFLMAACNSNPYLETQSEEGPVVPVTIQAAIDTSIQDGSTRAGGTGKLPEGYWLRCQLEVYHQTTHKVIARSQTYVKSDSQFAGSIKFPPVALPGGVTAKVVCWADYVLAKTKSDVFYDTSKGLSAIRQIDWNELTAITPEQLTNTGNGEGNNAEDAYTGQSEEFTLNADGTIETKEATKLTAIRLKRPFVKVYMPEINLVDKNGTAWSEELKELQLVYTKKLNTLYDAYTGIASAEDEKEINYSYPTGVQSDFSLPFALHHYYLVSFPTTDLIQQDCYLRAKKSDETEVIFKRYIIDQIGEGDTYKYVNVHLEFTKPNCLMTIRGKSVSGPTGTIVPLTFREVLSE